MLNGESKVTKPATLEIINDQQVRLSISEGRYHQVKRMIAALGSHVESLHREAIGQINLDPLLQPGQFRLLSSSEHALF